MAEKHGVMLDRTEWSPNVEDLSYCAKNGIQPRTIEIQRVELCSARTLIDVFCRGIESMALDQIPTSLRARYKFDERDHACAILARDFRNEFKDLMDCLASFSLKKSDILTPGGGRSPIPIAIDGFLASRGWQPKHFNIKIEVDDAPIPIPTHSIDNFKNRVGVEVEWNNKTEFYDRDLNNFRLLKDLRVLSVGVIITRLSELQLLFNDLGKGPSYGASTTHWDKLIPKVQGGGAGCCPLLLIGMGKACYDPNA